MIDKAEISEIIECAINGSYTLNEATDYIYNTINMDEQSEYAKRCDELIELRNAYKNMTEAVQESRKGKDLKKKIYTLDRQLKNIDKSLKTPTYDCLSGNYNPNYRFKNKLKDRFKIPLPVLLCMAFIIIIILFVLIYKIGINLIESWTI